MKIFNAQQIWHWDQSTLKEKHISSEELMERAAGACFDWIIKKVNFKDKEVCIFCGVGNNGGDGLVIARKLLGIGVSVRVFIVQFREKFSQEFELNYKKLDEFDFDLQYLKKDNLVFELNSNSIVIDAIFGNGLTKSPIGFVKEIIQKINLYNGLVISIDLPSGLPSDYQVIDQNAVVKANHTLTFQTPKLTILLPDNHCFVGELHIIDIGLSEKFEQNHNSSNEFVDLSFVKSLFKIRNKFSHKGNFGHALLMGGSYGKMGAVVMATKAALKVGSGLTTSYVPKCGYEILQISIPEAMTEVDDENEITYFNYKCEPDVIGLGMGMGTSSSTIEGFKRFLKGNEYPLVIDADGLNLLAKNKELLKLIPPKTILTPHPKELQRLVGNWKDDFEKMNEMEKFSTQYDCIIVLKGAHTLITYKNQKYFNSTGNPGLAKGGSGDVLTGMITGLIAQQYNPIQASIIGVFIHGLAADIAIRKGYSEESLCATDLFQFFGEAFHQISN